MRYRVAGVEIRSENAAKPWSQRHAEVVRILRRLPRGLNVADVGCGKLRYASIMARHARRIVLVDSHVQLTRVQKVNGRMTTVSDYVAKNWPNASCRAVETDWSVPKSSDFALCANVLSAIPRRTARLELLSQIRTSLVDQGTCLLVTQFANSEFDKYATRDNCEPHLDGWLIHGRRGTAFYAQLDSNALMQLCRRSRLRVVESVERDGRAYLWVSRDSK